MVSVQVFVLPSKPSRSEILRSSLLEKRFYLSAVFFCFSSSNLVVFYQSSVSFGFV